MFANWYRSSIRTLDTVSSTIYWFSCYMEHFKKKAGELKGLESDSIPLSRDVEFMQGSRQQNHINPIFFVSSFMDNTQHLILINFRRFVKSEYPTLHNWWYLQITSHWNAFKIHKFMKALYDSYRRIRQEKSIKLYKIYMFYYSIKITLSVTNDVTNKLFSNRMK